MKIYRFSPIKTEKQLMQAIRHIHIESHKLCKNILGKSLENAGNIGVFCHYDDEFIQLKNIRQKLTFNSKNPDQKYFLLHNPIAIPKKGSVPKTIYTHLYIRKPDPYRHHVGDIDFFLTPKEYRNLKNLVLSGKTPPGARIFDRSDLDMIELYHPDSDVLAYVSTKKMTARVRRKLSSATKL